MSSPIFIFTWKPEKFTWERISKPGETFDWLTCAYKQNKKGDHFILVRTGQKDPGIVGYGTLSTNPYEGIDYTGEQGWLVGLKFNNIINNQNDKPLIARNELVSLFPMTNSNSWAPQSNGVKVSEAISNQLFELLFTGEPLSKSTFETDNNVSTGITYRQVKQRIGQDRLRNELLAQFGCCEISGLTNNTLLRASHIKPWSIDPKNRGNINNALLLAVPYDCLFDQGLISFDKDGVILISSKLSERDKQVFSLRSDFRLNSKRNKSISKFLNWHRKHLFQK